MSFYLRLVLPLPINNQIQFLLCNLAHNSLDNDFSLLRKINWALCYNCIYFSIYHLDDYMATGNTFYIFLSKKLLIAKEMRKNDFDINSNSYQTLKSREAF